MPNQVPHVREPSAPAIRAPAHGGPLGAQDDGHPDRPPVIRLARRVTVDAFWAGRNFAMRHSARLAA